MKIAIHVSMLLQIYKLIPYGSSLISVVHCTASLVCSRLLLVDYMKYDMFVHVASLKVKLANSFTTSFQKSDSSVP